MSKSFRGYNFYVCRSYTGKTGRGGGGFFAPPTIVNRVREKSQVLYFKHFGGSLGDIFKTLIEKKH